MQRIFWILLTALAFILPLEAHEHRYSPDTRSKSHAGHYDRHHHHDRHCRPHRHVLPERHPHRYGDRDLYRVERREHIRVETYPFPFPPLPGEIVIRF